MIFRTPENLISYKWDVPSNGKLVCLFVPDVNEMRSKKQLTLVGMELAEVRQCQKFWIG